MNSRVKIAGHMNIWSEGLTTDLALSGSQIKLKRMLLLSIMNSNKIKKDNINKTMFTLSLLPTILNTMVMSSNFPLVMCGN